MKNLLAGFAVGAFASLFALLLGFEPFSMWPSLGGCRVAVLGDPTYRTRRITAPSASGLLLRCLAAVVGASGLIGQLVRRAILNSNGMARLRVLALQIQHEARCPAQNYPIVRLSSGEHAAHEKRQREAQDVKKRDGPYNSISDYHAAFVSGRATPSAVLERCLMAVDALPPELRVFSEMVDRSVLFEEAEASSERYTKKSPLSVFDGVLIAIKDQVCVRGLNCTHGADPSWGSGTEVEDDGIVARLRQCGAIVLGLTVMTELGSSTLGYSARSRAPVNAYDKTRYPGGSSSGSGLGVALGLFPVALGFDAGGSIRLPSAMLGIVGLKCTWGRVAASQDFCWVNMSAGPMACCAADAALFYEVIAKPVAEHFYSRLYGPTPSTPWYGPTAMPSVHCFGFNDVDDLSGLKLGVYWEWFEDCEAEVCTRAHVALAFLRQKGAEVVSVTIPHLDILALAHLASISGEMTFANERQFSEAPMTLEPATRMQLALGGAISGTELLASQWLRGWMMCHLDGIFREHGLSGIFTPTVGLLPPPMPSSAAVTGESNTTVVCATLRYMFLANVCGLPCISMPAGLSQGGLPVGVQLIAKHWDEHVCLRVANAMDVPRFRSVPPDFVDLLEAES